jgi:hypothetical protein
MREDNDMIFWDDKPENLEDIICRFTHEVNDHFGYPVATYTYTKTNDGSFNVIDADGNDIEPPVGGKTEKDICLAISNWRESQGLEAF